MDTHDRIRDWVEGRLSPAEEARLERELEASPELADFAEHYRAVHALTALADAEAPAVRTRFEDLALDGDVSPRRFGVRRVAAAAVITLVTGAAALSVLGRHGSAAPVELSAVPRAVPWEDAAPPPLAETVAPRLRDYRPVEQGEIHWLDSLEEGRSAAEATGRPIFVFGMFQTCEWCKAMKRTSLKDEFVLDLVTEFVPVQIDLMQVDESERDALVGRGYPFFEVQEPDGRILYNFSGFHQEAETFRLSLEEGLARRGEHTAPLSWRDARELAELYVDARASEDEAHFGDAYRSFLKLSELGEGRLFVAAGKHGLRRLALLASDDLGAAVASPGNAVYVLEGAVRRFAGTPYERDLEVVLERTRTDGRVPQLVWAEYE